MKRFASFSAAIALAAAAGIAHAQVSQDDYSVLTGPNAQHVVSSASSSAIRASAAQAPTNNDLAQGIVGPNAVRAAGTPVTRAQVKAEIEQARAEGKLVPGYEYLAAGGAPTGSVNAPATSFAGGNATPAGQ